MIRDNRLAVQSLVQSRRASRLRFAHWRGYENISVYARRGLWDANRVPAGVRIVEAQPHHADVLRAFLDALGLAHENGLIAEDQEQALPASKLGPAVAALDEQFPHEDVTVYLFPETDHGIFEYKTLPDGSRQLTHTAEGYFRLLGDWMKGRANGVYGRAQRLP